MPCYSFSDPKSGARGFICTGRRAWKKCFVSHCRARGEVLCDWPMEGAKTCDRRCCRAHSKRVGPDKDYCLEHALLHSKGKLSC